MIKVIVAEDNDVVRDGVVGIFSAQKDISVIEQAVNGLETLNLQASDLTADIVLTDLNMPQMNGIELTNCLAKHFPALKVIVLSMHGNQHFIN